MRKPWNPWRRIAIRNANFMLLTVIRDILMETWTSEALLTCLDGFRCNDTMLSNLTSSHTQQPITTIIYTHLRQKSGDEIF